MKKTLMALLLSMVVAPVAMALHIKVAFDADPVSLDPQEQLSQGTMQMGNWVFDPLVRFDHNLKPVPALAVSWEQISPTVMRFHLRKGVVFHSGNPFTADDVLFTFKRILTSGDFKGLFTAFKDVRKVDDYTVDFETKGVYPLVMQNVHYLYIMDSKFYSGKDANGNPKDQIAKNVGSFASLHESGTGPYVVQSRQQGVKTEFVKFKHYWGKMGNVDGFTLLPIKEDATRVAALLSGDVDFIYPVPPNDLERVKNAPGKVLYTLPSDRIITFEMNQKVVPQFRDKRVRLAVIYAVNNVGIAQRLMRGAATPSAQFSPEGYSGYNPKLKPVYDLAKAKQLMKEAGYANGFTITMISPNNRYVNDEKIAQAVAAMLAKINIKVNLTTMPKAQYWEAFDKCENGMQMIGWSSDTGDSANYSQYLTMTRNDKTGDGQYNCGFYSNPVLDNMVRQANNMVAGPERNALLQQVSQIEADDAAALTLHFENQNFGYDNTFTNFPSIVNINNFPAFQDLVIKK